MLVRLFLAFWMLFTSAFGSALCCCVPLALPLLHSKAIAAEPVRAPESHCPLCKSHVPVQPEKSKPAEKCPCGPNSPGQKDCPCRSHHLTPVIVESAGVETLLPTAWALTLALPVVLPAAHQQVFAETVRTDHTGPPPLSGVDLLHRLHILVC